MSSSLHQIQLSYDQLQDRLTLVFFTLDFFEYRFYITRRVLKGLCQLLKQLRSLNPKHSLMIKQTDFDGKSPPVQQEVQYPDAKKYGTSLTRMPLGSEPLLLCTISATPGEHGNVRFKLEDHLGHAVDFDGNMIIVNSLIQLVEKIMPITEWEIETDF